MSGSIKPRYQFQAFENKANGWAEAKNREACKLDSILYPCADDIGPLPAIGTIAGQQWVDDSDNCLYTWDGLKWFKCAPKEGLVVRIKTKECFYFFDGTSWVDTLNAEKVRTFLENNLNVFYAFSVGQGDPTAPPQFNFPFYQDTLTNDVWIYNFNNDTWLPLQDESRIVSNGAGSAGFFIEANSDGQIDSSWFSFIDANGEIDLSYLGVIPKANLEIIDPGTGLIDPACLPPTPPPLCAYHVGRTSSYSLSDGVQNVVYDQVTSSKNITITGGTGTTAQNFVIDVPGTYQVTASVILRETDERLHTLKLDAVTSQGIFDGPLFSRDSTDLSLQTQFDELIATVSFGAAFNAGDFINFLTDYAVSFFTSTNAIGGHVSIIRTGDI